MKPSTKPRIAFFDFAGCEGCQLTVVDVLQDHPELLGVVEIVQFREAMSERDENYQIAFVEGSYTRDSDLDRLNTIRAQAQIVVALGACAHLGGVNALRNWQSTAEVRRYVYGQGRQSYNGHQKALPVGEAIQVDYVIPGCPIDRGEFIRFVKALLMNRVPHLPEYPVCNECKLAENGCLFLSGIPCLGSITRAGCGAICPSYGTGCEGCRGLVEDPNIGWLKAAATEHGVSQDRLDAAMKIFLTNSFIESEVDSYGKH